MDLSKYKAKSDGTTLEEHNSDLMVIKEQIKYIYNIDKKLDKMLDNSIHKHDFGKVTDSFQNDIEGKNRRIRHEINSASVKGLIDKERLSIITHHKEIEELMRYIENEYYEDEIEEMSNKLGVEVEDIRGFIKKINRKSNPLLKDLEAMLLKGYLQYCDHVASAGIKHIDKGFNPINIFKFNNYNSIQKEVLGLSEKQDIMMVSSTGSGKTFASLLWSNLMQNKEKSKRIYYLLPYTASINSLYKDMLYRDVSVAMMHNKAEYFLGEMEIENTKEMYNLYRKSIKQLNISTIYQIVKAIFSCKRFEMLLAQLKDSIFIIDEIHCFDVEQLALLLTTLKFLKDKLNISICIMSASIPACLQELICKELNIGKIIRLSKKDYKVRHRVNRIKRTVMDDLDKIKDDLNNGKRVIICVNSVAYAQLLYTKLKEYTPVLIHGRFNTRDREKNEKHLKTVNILIGTQAIEVSLDISYDVLYTEIAPLDALLQRFGRVNRFGEKGIADIFIYDNFIFPNSKCVYSKLLLERTDLVIEKIINEDKSIVLEGKIQEYLDEVYADIDMEVYEKISSRINEVINTLRVGHYNKTASRDMLTSNTISVLPQSLFDEYMELIESKKYLEAQALFVNVSSYMMKYTTEINGIYVIDFIYDDRGLVYERDVE